MLLWWRDGDGDLVDMLVDALGPLADNGVVWLLTPKAGRDGHVEPSDITESAPTAGPCPDVDDQRRRRLERRPTGGAEGGAREALSPPFPLRRPRVAVAVAVACLAALALRLLGAFLPGVGRSSWPWHAGTESSPLR